MTKAEQKRMKAFIPALHALYKTHCIDTLAEDGRPDRYVYHVFYIAAREITRMIGEGKNTRISRKAKTLLGIKADAGIRALNKAKKRHPREIVKEHYKPAEMFFRDFRREKFSKAAAGRWLEEAVIAFITKEEDAALYRKGYGRERPNPEEAYGEARIVLEAFDLHGKAAVRGAPLARA